MILETLKGKDPIKKKPLIALAAGGKITPQEALELKKISMAEPRAENGLLAFTLLARSGDADAIKKLSALLKDASIHVRMMAQRSLIFAGPPAIEPILMSLEAADDELLAQYTEILRRIPKSDPEPFLPLLQSGPPQVKVALVRVLGSFGATEKAVVPLIKALSSVDAKMNEAIVQSLVDVGQKVVPILGKLVATSPPRVIESIFTIVGRIGEPVKAFLHEMLAGTNPAAKRGAARALAFASDDRSAELLVAALADKDALLAEAACGALRTHQVAFRDRLKRTFRESKSVNQRFWLLRLFHHDVEFFEEMLIQAFQSKDTHERVLAVCSVGPTFIPLIYNRLVEGLNDPDFYVRELSIDKLQMLSAERIPELIKALGDSRAGVVDGIIETLRRLGERAVDALLELVARGNDQQKINAANALGLIGNRKAVQPLRALLLAGNDWVRQYALGALGHLGDMETLLQQVQKGTEENRKMAMRALSAMGPGALEPLLSLLRETKPDHREGIAQTIASLGESVKPRVEELAQTEEDENVRFWMMKIHRLVGKKGGLV